MGFEKAPDTQHQRVLDNTLRAVHRLGGAWRVGSSRVLLHVRVGARARLAVRRGHRQNFVVRLMAAIGYIPGALVDTMELPGTTYRLARTARAFPTARGHVQIEEMEVMEARVKYLGGHYLYFCVSVITHFEAPVPSDSEELSWSDVDSSSSETFV